jgi:hypothetical protein
VLHVTDLQGRYVGKVGRRDRVDIRDTAAIGAEQAEVSRLIHACVVGPVRERHAAEDAALKAADEHNVRLQLEAGIEKPVRMTPEAKSISPAAHSTPTGTTAALAARTADKADLGPKPERQGLSSKLQAPARDAFAAYKGNLELAQGIAAEVTAADAIATRSAAVRAQAEALTPEDLQAFGTAPASPLPAAPAEPEQTMDDYS